MKPYDLYRMYPQQRFTRIYMHKKSQNKARNYPEIARDRCVIQQDPRTPDQIARRDITVSPQWIEDAQQRARIRRRGSGGYGI